MTDRKTENYIGLCRAAGGVTTGFDLVLGEVRRKKAAFVLVADDASERTKKQISDKCEHYGVKWFRAGYTAEELARLIGKNAPCAAAAFTGRGPCRPLLSLYEERAACGTTDENTNENGNAAMTERMIVDGSKTNIGV